MIFFQRVLTSATPASDANGNSSAASEEFESLDIGDNSNDNRELLFSRRTDRLLFKESRGGVLCGRIAYNITICESSATTCFPKEQAVTLIDGTVSSRAVRLRGSQR